ncbi:MAG: glycosyltransferase family 4 protein [Actinomycetota bacterium]|nr:glycosyltransferase family 4 protein [Actinomycetota bacterium]
MRIAILGSIAWRTPPRAYGPWERVAGLIASGLQERGVDVTLFATLDSQTPASLDGVCRSGYAEDPELDGRVWEALHVAHALGRSDEFDLVHNHLDWLPLAFEQFARAPLVTTIHGFSGPAIMPVYQRSTSAFVSISLADRAPGLRYAANVYHGVESAELPFDPAGGDSLVCFGRIHPDKGTADAIEIAARAGRRLVLCGIVHDEVYFREHVEPHIDGDRVTYLGSVGPEQRAEVLGGSAVLLHPVAFAEPFGLSVVESMMCGTPVVAYARGSMSEIVDEGSTGYLVADVEEATAAVDRAAALDRAACRQVAERRFSAARMVDDYLRVYHEVLEGEAG